MNARLSFALRVIVLTLGILLMLALYTDEMLALLFGCGLTLVRFFRDRTINVPAGAGFVAGAVVFAVGVHLFASWLAKEWQSRAGQLTIRPWRRRWTAALVALVFIFFAAGVCILGVTHQIAWLVTDPEGITTKSSPF